MYFVFGFLYTYDANVRSLDNSRKINNCLVEQIEGNANKIYIESEKNKYFDETTFIYKLSYKVDIESKKWSINTIL